ncbi:MAG: exodeoxyribonuclease III [Desulfurobacteriaceae bacterium]
MITVATWNVNSIRAREKLVIKWLKENSVDALAIQEIKVGEELYPYSSFSSIGYSCSVHGQKAYNGVATCTRLKPIEVLKGWPDGEEDEKRIITVRFKEFSLINVYVPRGGEKGTERHAYKIYFLTKLKLFLEENFSPKDPVIVAGDFNVALEDKDVYDPMIWKGRPGFMEEEREAMKELLSFGLYDLFREKNPQRIQFTWWDIETGAFTRNRGLRIDYIFATKPLLERCTECDVDVEARRKKGNFLPSDHAPVYAKFEL